MSHRPVIGITAFETRYIEPPHLPIFALNRRYVTAVAAAGGSPLIVPPGLDESSLKAIFAKLDGVLLSGGGDVDPACYGEAPHPALIEVSADRDRLELSFARWAVDADRPLLAICRGIQVLNVALGGSLVQHIPAQWPNPLAHTFDGTKVARDHIAHTVNIDPDTRLRDVLGVAQVSVNSWHHQSVKKVAPDLKVTACAPDGVIEAVERPDRRFAIGVQWHPEWLYDKQPETQRLFEALVKSAE